MRKRDRPRPRVDWNEKIQKVLEKCCPKMQDIQNMTQERNEWGDIWIRGPGPGSTPQASHPQV